jgi:Tfp pilus assembly protein PilX
MNTNRNTQVEQSIHRFGSRNCVETGKASQRGVALVIALLMLMLISALSLAMVIAMTSETLIGGYYRNFRGSFYAADSGLNIARQKIVTQLATGVPATFAYPPTAASCGSISNVTVGTDYANATSLNAGNAATSWAEKFKVTTVQVGAPTQLSNAQAKTYSCTYTYALAAVGAAEGSEQQTITETGSILVNVSGQNATQSVSFAYFGGFVDVYPGGSGALIPGTMTGPMFTNNAWEFMAAIPPWTAPYIFTDPVGQNWSNAYWWDKSWNWHLSPGPSYGSGSGLIAPTFQQGLYVSQPTVPLPANSFNQEEAVIDGNGTQYSSAPTTAQLGALTNIAGTAYSGSTTSGVFMNQGTTTTACGTRTPPCIAGGGFFVQGGADVQLLPSGSTAQVYKVLQNGTTTTITIDPAASSGVGSTVVTQGSTSLTLSGVPMDTLTSQASTMVYVNGTITVHGPGEGQGAVQDNAMITVTANGDIVATGDVLYKTEPVSIPLDQLVPGAANMNQVLGLFTATGNFITRNSQTDQNIEVDGSIAAISQADSANNCSGGKGGQLSQGHVNTFNNVGGMIQSCIYAADVNVQNTWFDRRFTSRQGFAPPWFPSTSIQTGGPLPTNVTSQVLRVQWVNTSSE